MPKSRSAAGPRPGLFAHKLRWHTPDTENVLTTYTYA